MPDGLHHTIQRKDGTKLNAHDFHLRLKHQPDLSNIPSTPLEYCKEVGSGITKEEAEQLAHHPKRPTTSPQPSSARTTGLASPSLSSILSKDFPTSQI
jgi:hypothetical protein